MGERFLRLRRLRKEAQTLLDESAWRSERELPRLHKFLHFWVLVWRSFSRNRCPVRAAALAYGSLLALIPVLVVVMSVTTSFLKKEGAERIDHFIEKLVASVTPRPALKANAPQTLPEAIGSITNIAGITNEVATGIHQGARSGAESGNPNPNRKLLPSLAQQKDAVEARKEIAQQIHDFIRKTRSSALGLTGSIALIFAAISMLSQIESTFNDIWGVGQGRGWFMRVVLYWTVISLAPMLVVVAVGLTTGPHWEATRRLLTIMPFVANLVFKFVPVALLCLALALFYRTIPNTKVHWNAALVGGLVGGILWHLNNLISVLYVSRVVSNSKIYGSLGLVPVFMIGLYLSWWVLLFGAQVAYAFQNRSSYLEQKQVETIDQRGRELIALRLMAWIGRQFLKGEPPPSIMQMGQELGVPTRLIQQLMQTLRAAGLVVGVSGQDPAYLPARPLEQITCHDILLAMRTSHGQQLTAHEEPTTSKVYGEFRRIEQAEREVASSVSLRALAEVSRAGIHELEREKSSHRHTESNRPNNQRSLTE